jgi:cell division protein YceG involved in septum cleavage
MVKYLKKKNGYLFGGIIIISSWIALVGLILFWPQQNPYSLAKVTVYSGMTLRSLSKQLYEKKIISNEQMFRWAVQIMGKEKEIPVGTFRVVNAQSNYKIIDQLVYGSPERKKVRFLEGWSMAQIANHLNEIM